MRTDLSANPAKAPPPNAAPALSSPKRLIAVGATVLVLGGVVLWLNFGRTGGHPPSDALEAARAAAADMAAAEPPPDPAAPPAPPPVPSPARPTPLGGR